MSSWRTSVLHSSHKQMCGLQGIRYVVKKKRSTCGRRVGEGVLGDAGYAGLKVCHQSCYCLELDAIRADEINTYGRPRGWIVWMRYFCIGSWSEVLGRSKPEASEHGRYLKGQRVDNTGKESSGWKIQDSLLESLITAEEGAGTNTDIQNSKDLR